MFLNHTCLLIDQRKRPVGQYSIINYYLGACLEDFLDNGDYGIIETTSENTELLDKEWVNLRLLNNNMNIATYFFILFKTNSCTLFNTHIYSHLKH
jgi:hypothetical protein